MTKIVFLSCVLSGDNPRGIQMMRALRDAGHEVVAVTAPTKAASENGVLGIRHIALRAPRANFLPTAGIRGLYRAIIDRIRNSLRLYRLAIAEKPDACVCHEPDSWVVGLLVKRKLGCRLLVDLREVYRDRAAAFPPLLRGFVAWGTDCVIRFLARRSDGIIHVSSYRADYYALENPRTVVVHHRSDPTLFEGISPLRPAELEGRLIFIHAGPLRLNYAAAEILAAIESLGTMVPELVVLVVGGSAVPAELNSLLETLQRRGRIVMWPYVRRAEVAALIKGSDVGLSVVLPVDVTHRLASPTKLYEYFDAGLPVIGSNVPEVRDVLTAWQCGLLVDATKPSDIAAAMLRLTTDCDLRHSLARNSRAAARDLDWNTEQKVLVDFVGQRLTEGVVRRTLPGQRSSREPKDEEG